MCSLLINPWFNNQLYDIANIKITKFYTKEELIVHFNELKELFDEKKIFNSFNKAKKGKGLSEEIAIFKEELSQNLDLILITILNNSYIFGPYSSFIKYDNKKRYIVTSPFKDRLVHWILYDYLESIYEKTFIYDSFGNRKAKGTKAGALRAKDFIQKEQTKYILQIDLSKYFYSIHHDRLIKCLKKVNNPYLHRILTNLINSYQTPNIFDNIFKEGSVYFEIDEKGMPIGILSSQILANIFLNPLDHYIKEKMRIKYYIRYVDDMVFFVNTKEEAHLILNKVQELLLNQFKIELNPRKANIFPISENHPLDFLGYRISKYKMLPRKRTQKKIRKALLLGNKVALVSYKGILKNTNSHLIKQVDFALM